MTELKKCPYCKKLMYYKRENLITVYAAIRHNIEESYLWIDTSSIALSLEESKHKAEITENTIPAWAVSNAVDHFEQFKLEEI